MLTLLYTGTISNYLAIIIIDKNKKQINDQRICSHLASPVMLNKIPMSSLKQQVICFKPKLNSFKSPIQIDAEWCVKIFLKVACNLSNILWKTK